MSTGLKGVWKRIKCNSLKWKIKELHWELRYAWKRAWYGYDDREIFAMNDMFRDRYINILKDYNKHRHCVWNIPEEYRDVLGEFFFTDEQTDVIIDMMIFYLQMTDEDYVEKYIYGKNCFDDDFDFDKEFDVKKISTACEIAHQNKELFMEMFNVFFWQL